MKKASVLSAIFCLLFAATVFAQEKTANFAGNWELDVSKSKLDERMRVKSMTMKVAQTDKELKIENTLMRLAPPAGETPNGADGMRRGGRMMGDGAQGATYNLEGKETTAEIGDGRMGGTTTFKTSIENGGKLKLTSVRKINAPTGDFTFTTTETWELQDEGKTLKIVREAETRRGTQTSEMYFTKKDSNAAPANELLYTVKGSSDVTGSVSKQISGGVLNGKASKLVLPDYPPAARAVKASGAVNVQVTIDEQGNVVSASAVSGHPLLRAAAVEAARNSIFAPTMLQGVPVRVTGVIVYNFVP
ncbi:MAG: energy transducer TonB [Acidobacteria bacterium]|nr:energy transducer TonB [Acidobacteriota bacterium]